MNKHTWKHAVSITALPLTIVCLFGLLASHYQHMKTKRELSWTRVELSFCQKDKSPYYNNFSAPKDTSDSIFPDQELQNKKASALYQHQLDKIDALIKAIQRKRENESKN